MAVVVPAVDVPVTTQLKFQQSLQYVFVKVPQIQFIVRLRTLSCAQTRVLTVRAVQKSSNSTGQFLERLLPHPLLCYDRCQGWSRQCRSGDSTGADPGRGGLARCAMAGILVQTVRKLGAPRKSDAYASLLRFSHLSRGLRAGAHFLGALDD